MIDTVSEKQYLKLSNILLFQVLHSFWFTANELEYYRLHVIYYRCYSYKTLIEVHKMYGQMRPN